MTDEQKSFQSNLSEKQFTLVRLEVLLDEMTNTLGSVKTDALDGRTSRSYPTLRQQYMNVLLRTVALRKNTTEEFMPNKFETCNMLCDKIEKYIGFLQDNGIYNLGREDFGI